MTAEQKTFYEPQRDSTSMLHEFAQASNPVDLGLGSEEIDDFFSRQSRSFLRSRIKYSAPLYVGLVLFYTARFLTLLRGDPFTWVFQVMSAISTLMVPLAIFLSSQFLRATPIWDSLSAASKVMKSLSVLFDGFRQQHRLKFFKYPLDDLNERHWICGQ